jgi:hypothetical protein
VVDKHAIRLSELWRGRCGRRKRNEKQRQKEQ